MTQAQAPGTVQEPASAGSASPTGWVGWTTFAAIMLMVIGALHLIYGIVAVANDEWVVWGNTGAVLIDVSAWGWIHVIAGIVVFLSGIGVLMGNIAARAVGVAVAAISLVANFLSLPLYPFWSLTMIVVALLVIWALTAHGSEMRAR